jgi:hypothetical protein
MATLKQKRVAKALVENMVTDKPRTAGQLLVKVGYSRSMSTAKPKEVLESKGVQEALEELGFTEENAMKVVSEIMLNPKKDANARLKATDQVFKVKGSYAPEKHQNMNINVNVEAREKSRAVIRQYLGK